MENVKIIAEQIEKLLQRLDDHRKSFFEPAPEQRPQRIYFIDSDVIYDYINGCIKNPFNDWASLLSLDSSVKGGSRKELSKELDDLTQVIGQAVTRFLFGQFNLQLGAQQKRYYLAAEHEREMRSMIVSILHQAFDGGFERWSELESCYIGLCKKNFSPAQALHAVESIFNTIIDRSEFGMIPRAYAVDRNFTSSLSTNLIRPTVVDASSFIFSEEDRDYDEGFKQLKSAFFEDFLKWLKEQSSGAEKYFPLKRKVFDMHGPRVPFYYYINALSSEPHLFSHVIDFESDLRLRAAMAINEVNDVASLARLTSLAKYLNKKHALPENKHWEVCLISGSLRLQGLLSSLKNTEFRGLLEDRVRLIHPLCFLRHPELYDPDGVKALGEDEHQDEEYALTWIFDQKERDYTKINDEKKVREFIDSLTRTLQGVVVREVRRHDYALRDFHRKIDFNDGYDSQVMMSNIRNYIAHKFTDTFLKLTEMSFDNRHRLSCVSLPVLDLRYSEKALKLLKLIHDSASDGSEADCCSDYKQNQNVVAPGFQAQQDLFEKLLEDDSTGYSAMLCASMAFIVRGERWLQPAQVMASTAVMFALGSRGEGGYPQGNEALYLRTFISRIGWDPEKETEQPPPNLQEQIGSWLDGQLKALDAAKKELDNWRDLTPDHASWALVGDFPSDSKKLRYDLMCFRYSVEELANKCFALQWECFLSEKGKGEVRPEDYLKKLLVLLKDSCVKVEHFYSGADGFARMLGYKKCDEFFAEHYRQTVAFVMSQLWAVILQSWLMLRFYKMPNRSDFEYNFGLDRDLASQELVISKYLPDYQKSMRDQTGQVVHLIMETYAVAKLGERMGAWQVTRACFDRVKFAVIDKYRFGFFEKCWKKAGALKGAESV